MKKTIDIILAQVYNKDSRRNNKKEGGSMKAYTNIVNEFGDVCGKVSKNSSTEWTVYLYGNCYGDMRERAIESLLLRLGLYTE